jgi:hypothetical protein
MGNGYMGNKTIVVGMLERGGELVTQAITRGHQSCDARAHP